MMDLIREAHSKLHHDSFIEIGTVISASPLVVSLDLATGVTLDFNKGDFVMPDTLILGLGNRVVLARTLNPHLYAVLYRIRGNFGKAIIGDAATAKVVARAGDITDTVAVGDHGSHAHVILQGASKVVVD